jgi:anaphase-promoting complex subunit 3
MAVSEPLSAAIWFCLNHCDYSNAAFLAERLHAEVSSEDTLYLLAMCYYRQGNIKRASYLLSCHPLSNPESKYLSARCLVEQEKYALAEQELTGSSNLRKHEPAVDSIAEEYGQLSGHVFALLAQCCRQTYRDEKAAFYLKASLKHNPFLWESFSTLCLMGIEISPKQYFQPEACPLFSAPSLAVKNKRTINQLIDTSQPYPIASSDENVDPNQKPPARQLRLCTPQIREVSVSTSSLMSATDLQQTATGMETATGFTPFLAETATSSGIRMNNQKSFLKLKPGTPMSPLFGVLPMMTLPGTPITSDVTFTTPSSSQLMTPNITASTTRLQTSYHTPQTRTQAMAPPPVPTKPQPVRRTEKSVPPNSPATQSPALPSNPPVTRKVQTRSASRDSRQAQVASPPRRSARLSGLTPINTPRSHGRKINTRSMATQSKVKSKPPVHLQSPLISPTSSTPFTAHVQQSCATVVDPSPLSTTKPDVMSTTALSGVKELPETPGVVETASYAMAANHTVLVEALRQGLESLMNLLSAIGFAYCALWAYDCKQALKLFNQLPPHHFNTSWVLRHVARAHFESAQYKKAAKVFHEIRNNDPHLHEDMDVFSSILWHTQEEMELSKLAHDLTDSNKKTPQAWCAVGNCFSLQRDHESAIKFFERACQVDSMFAYAHTLLGHEYLAVDNAAKALACFRNALKANSRHYNAWYGIGMVYYKQEKYKLAEFHFSRSLAINCSNAVLCCHIGIVSILPDMLAD